IANITNASLNVAFGGAITNSGILQFNNSGPITLTGGATPRTALTLNPGSTFTMANTLGSAGINIGANSSSAGSIMTVSGATVTLDKLISLADNASVVAITNETINFNGNSRINDTNNDVNTRIQMNGGNVNLGNFSVYRSTPTGGLFSSN